MSRERVVTVLMNAGVAVKGYEAVTLYDALAAAGLLLDERAQACVEACKAFRSKWPRGVLTDPLNVEMWDAGAAYDAPKPDREAAVNEAIAALRAWKEDREVTMQHFDRMHAAVVALDALSEEGRKP